MAHTQERPDLDHSPEVKNPWLWNVVLLDDDEHSYEYVIAMAQKVFSHTAARAFETARTVDVHGRAILTTTHRELAELKREQVIGFGPDLFVAHSTGPMRVVLEPAEDQDDG